MNHPPVKHIPHYFWVICVLIAALILIFGGNYDAQAQQRLRGPNAMIYELCYKDQPYAVFVFEAGQASVLPIRGECTLEAAPSSAPPA